ncbi:MAG: flagellar hook assembly protein FlgD [Candidatus Latescibacteria bacterium]|nr:flagellar hook assembly protein FlgD [Candidatus Latescibacterota bacterium]
MVSGISNETQYYTPETSATQGTIWGSTEEDVETAASKDVSSLGKDDFLKLLIAELQNQDPLNPADNTEFIAQLAQFSSLEQMTTMNDNLEKVLTYNKSVTESINNSMMVNFIGKTVTAVSDEFVYDGLNPVELGFELDQDISRGTLEIYNENEVLVKTISLDSMEAGLRSTVWDGFTDLGLLAGDGIYTYKVNYYDMVENQGEATTVFSGTVEGVSYKDGMAYLDINGMLVPFNEITHIVQEDE